MKWIVAIHVVLWIIWLLDPIAVRAQATVVNRTVATTITAQSAVTTTLVAADSERAGPAPLSPQHPRFTHLTVDDGLSNNEVTAILQDRKGFVWIGTVAGLNRFDGYAVNTYLPEPGNPNSIVGHHIVGLLEDDDGMLWIATRNGGVSRFDPRTEQFTTFRSEPENPNSLISNSIRAIYQAPDGIIWFGGQGDNGLTEYDPATAKFTQYRQPERAMDANDSAQSAKATFPSARIRQFLTDGDGELWLLSDESLSRYLATTNRFQVYALPVDLKSGILQGFVLTASGDFWIAGDPGLLHFDRARNTFRLVAARAGSVYSLYRDQRNTVWVGAQSGLYQLNEQTEELHLVARHDPADPTSPAIGEIRTIYSDRAGLLWIGVRGGGVDRYDPRHDVVQRYAFNAEHPEQLAAPQISALFDSTDEAGTDAQETENEYADNDLWLVAGDVLHHLLPADTDNVAAVAGQFIVTQYPIPESIPVAGELEPTEPAPPTFAPPTLAPHTYRLFMDSQGILWLGREGRYLLRFDPATARFSDFLLVTAPEMPGPPPFVSGFSEDTNGNLWVAVHFDGLYRIDPTRSTVTRFRPNGPPDKFSDRPDTVSSALLSAIVGDDQGRLWLGYVNGVISQFDRTTAEFTHYPSRLALVERRPTARTDAPPGGGPPPDAPRRGPPPNGSAPNGPPPNGPPPSSPPKLLDNELPLDLMRIDGEIDSAVNPSAPVNALHWDAATGLLWIGAQNGLIRFDPTTATFTHYPLTEGPSLRMVMSIEQDQWGDLWLGTQTGIVHVQPATAAFHLYTTADGVQDDEYSPQASWRDPRGRLIFGGRRGLTRFEPADLNTGNPDAPLVLTEMRLFNTPVTVGNQSPLPSALWALDSLTLQPAQSIVSFEFALLDFAAPRQSRYRYRLDGLETLWNEVDSDRRFATYTTLAPGAYTFRVQGSNGNGTWQEPGTALAVTVLPRWWQTAWFRIALISLLVSAAAAASHWRSLSIQRRNRELQAQVIERTAALTAQTAALAESEERFRGLATSAFDAILIQQNQHIVEANDAAVELFGYPHVQLVGMPVATLLRQLLPALHPSPTATQALHHAVDGICADGTTIPLEIHMRTVPFEGEEATVIALRDLTERRAAEQQQQRLAALEERERIGRDLHDDLGQVIGYLNLQAQTARELLEQEKAPQAKSTLRALSDAAQEAHNDVRQYILGIRNRQSTATSETDLWTALALYAQQMAERHGLRVQLNLPAERPTPLLATQVETQLLRIIQEALTNVRNHAEVDMAQVIFTLQPDEVQVIISDTGRGFALATDAEGTEATDNVEHTQNGHHTAPRVAGHFGLEIMRERAAGVGGHVEVRSSPGSGTTVLVSVPRTMPFANQEDLRGLRVLLADDHPLYREGLRNLLSTRGLHVVGIAENGLVAEELAHKLLPDLILMDIEMPERNGIETAIMIKQALPEIKIIMLTVAATEATLLAALRGGASGYLLKNMDTDQFFSMLNEAIQGETVLSPKLSAAMLSQYASNDTTPVDEPTDIADVEQSATAPSANEQPGVPSQDATIAATPSPELDAALQQLTTRQREVLALILEGLTNKEIARQLHITESTVKHHVGLIFRRLQVNTRYDLMPITAPILHFLQRG